MSKLDILSNIDTVNYITQDVMTTIMNRPIVPRNNFYIADGYSCDILKTTKTKYTIVIRSAMQTLCRIVIDKDTITVRYNHTFMFTYKMKTNMFSTPLFDEPFELEEIEARYFTENCVGFNYDVQTKFDFQVMAETLSLSKDFFYVFTEYVKRQSVLDNN